MKIWANALYIEKNYKYTHKFFIYLRTTTTTNESIVHFMVGTLC